MCYSSSIVPVNRPKSASDGSSSHERGTQSSPGIIPNLHKDNYDVDVNKVGTMPHLQTFFVKQLPSFTPTFVAGVGVE